MDGIVALLQEQDIQLVRFEQVDMYGVPHCRAIPTRHFKKNALKGLNMSKCFLSFEPTGCTFEGSGYGMEVNMEDCLVRPDLETFTILPWLSKTARVLVEGEMNGKKIPGYPRVVAKHQLERLAEIGLSLWSAHEHEFYVVKKDTMEPFENQSYAFSSLRLSADENFIQDIAVDLPKAGVDVECVTYETHPGHVEITYRPEFGIKAADVAHTYKLGIKEIALKHGYIATFMSKPWPEKHGSSAHFCHSLWDVSGKVPKLYDSQSPTGLSAIGEHWVAGLLSHARAIAVLMAPTVNCLKRFLRHSFAPYNVTWGPDNRTCAFRVKVGGEEGTYIENRMGASACNPYISLAATVAAGLDGIARELPLPEATLDNAYDDKYIPPLTPALPTDMEDAVDALLADDIIVSALGPEFIKCFVAAKRNEMKLEKAAIAADRLEAWQREFLFYMM